METHLKTINDIPEDAQSDFRVISSFRDSTDTLYFSWNIFDENDLEYIEKSKQQQGCDVELIGYEYFKSKSADFITKESRYDLLTETIKEKKRGWYKVTTSTDFEELWNLGGPCYKCRMVKDGNDIENYEFEINSFDHMIEEIDQETHYRNHGIQFIQK